MLAEIREALTEGDAARLARAAHTFKGSVHVFGAPAVFEAAFRLEAAGRAGDLARASLECAALEMECERLQPMLAEWMQPDPR